MMCGYYANDLFPGPFAKSLCKIAIEKNQYQEAAVTDSNGKDTNVWEHFDKHHLDSVDLSFHSRYRCKLRARVFFLSDRLFGNIAPSFLI
jgi:hypothetical protein